MGIYLILVIIPVLIFIVGFVLSIVNFWAKKLALEIISWMCILICLIINTIIFFNSTHSGSFILGISYSQTFSIPISIVLFLLFQYRCNVAKEINMYRVFYALKSICLIQIVITILSIIINAIYSQSYSTLENSDSREILNYLIRGVNFIVFASLATLMTYQYLKTTSLLAPFKNLFIESLILILAVNFISDILNTSLMSIKLTSMDWISFYYVISVLIMTTVECVVGALIGTYIYVKQADKFSV